MKDAQWLFVAFLIVVVTWLLLVLWVKNSTAHLLQVLQRQHIKAQATIQELHDASHLKLQSLRWFSELRESTLGSTHRVAENNLRKIYAKQQEILTEIGSLKIEAPAFDSFSLIAALFKVPLWLFTISKLWLELSLWLHQISIETSSILRQADNSIGEVYQAINKLKSESESLLDKTSQALRKIADEEKLGIEVQSWRNCLETAQATLQNELVKLPIEQQNTSAELDLRIDQIRKALSSATAITEEITANINSRIEIDVKLKETNAIVSKWREQDHALIENKPDIYNQLESVAKGFDEVVRTSRQRWQLAEARRSADHYEAFAKATSAFLKYYDTIELLRPFKDDSPEMSEIQKALASFDGHWATVSQWLNADSDKQTLQQISEETTTLNRNTEDIYKRHQTAMHELQAKKLSLSNRRKCSGENYKVNWLA